MQFAKELNIYHCQGQLVLASTSPRRQEYLGMLGLPFLCHGAEVEETPLAGETPAAFAARMALAKATAVSEMYPQAWVIGGDTVVTVDSLLLGKPHAKEEAVAMLMQLSGKTHQVISGLALVNQVQGVSEVLTVATEVQFRVFTKNAAEAYVATGEPMDKAGAYGIQGVGAMLVKAVKGSYTNVVGLPLAEMVELLEGYGVISSFPQPGK